MRRVWKYFSDNIFEQKSRLIAFLPILFSLGICIYFSLSFEPSIWLTLTIAELTLLFVYICRFNNTYLICLGIWSLILFGFINIQLKSISLRLPENVQYFNKDTYLKGKIINKDKSFLGKVRITLKDLHDYDDNYVQGIYRFTLNHNFNSLQIGQCVELVAQTFPLIHPSDKNQYQFDRKLYFEGIHSLGYSFTDAYVVECPTEENNFQLSNFIHDMRQKIIKKIQNIMGEKESAVAIALIAGDRQFIDKALNEQYQNSGLAHFLAISGLHMGMIAFLVFFLFRNIIALFPQLALKYNSKKIAAFSAILLSAIYLIISGMQIPAQRAFIMTFCLLLGVILDREAISLRTLSIAAFIVLLFSPQSLISVSFQMSFSAVLVMLAFYEKYSTAINKFFSGGFIKRRILGYVVGIIIADFVATIATLPFVIYYFNRIAIYTLLGNLLAGPVICLIVMPFILLSLLAFPLGLEKLPLSIVDFGLQIINKITAYVSSLPNAGYNIVAMPFWGLMLIVIGGLWITIWQKSWRKWGIILIIIGYASLFAGEPVSNKFAKRSSDVNFDVQATYGKRFWNESAAKK